MAQGTLQKRDQEEYKSKKTRRKAEKAVFWTGYSHCGHRLTVASGTCTEFAQEWALQQSGTDGKEGHKAQRLVAGPFATDRFRERGNHCL